MAIAMSAIRSAALVIENFDRSPPPGMRVATIAGPQTTAAYERTSNDLIKGFLIVSPFSASISNFPSRLIPFGYFLRMIAAEGESNRVAYGGVLLVTVGDDIREELRETIALGRSQYSVRTFLSGLTPQEIEQPEEEAIDPRWLPGPST
jgi:hypothetical protein